MTSLAFVVGVGLLFALLLAIESGGNASQQRLKAIGLVTWISSGNWPAKVGSGLLILGVGALLRYALLNIEVPPELKLGSGFVVAGGLSALAWALKRRPERRAIHLALAGSAFGVAYLTAYAAYDFFHYVNDVNALALLALVSVAAGVFATSANAMSVAVLAMTGAYIAPKFAISSPGPATVYGYYLVISAACLAMVAGRGWRPLIHLSFLFALAGALFFGWSGKFYRPEYFLVMQPLLLALTAVHLAMPLVERHSHPAIWLARFDIAYFAALPAVAALLTLQIAPSIQREGALGLAALAFLWCGTAAFLALQQRKEAARHGFVAGLLAIGAALCLAVDLPWLLVGLGLSVTVLAAAPHLNWPRRVQELTCGAALLFGVLHVLMSIMQTAGTQIFANEVFVHRALASLLLGAGAWIAARRSIPQAKMLGLMAAMWGALSLFAELWRFEIAFLPQLVHGAVLAAIAVLAHLGRGKTRNVPVAVLLIATLAASSLWAADEAGPLAAIVFLAATALTLLFVAWSANDRDGQGNDLRAAVALALLPIAVLPWASPLADEFGISTRYFAATVAVVGVLASTAAARFWLAERSRWYLQFGPVYFLLVAAALLYVTLFHIERGPWPVAFDLLALACLFALALQGGPVQGSATSGVTLVVCTALVAQAMLLRGFGPEGTMNATDLAKMKFPAVVSLVWAVFGAGLAWWGTRTKSRSVWAFGAAVLVVATGKLVLRDFGSLEELGNILAMIGAGLVFMAVAWFAPMPPKPVAVPVNARNRPGPASMRQDIDPQGDAQVADAAWNGITKEPAATAVASGAAARPGPASYPDAARRASASRDYATETVGQHWIWIAMLVLVVAAFAVAYGWMESKRRSRLALLSQPAAVQPTSEEGANPYGFGTSHVGQISSQRPTTAAEAASYRATSEAASKREFPVCREFVSQLPSDYVLYAGGSHSGRKLNVQIDPSGLDATRFDVTVNLPGKNVVLALSANDPSFWYIQWTTGTVIAGVMASAPNRQILEGPARNIPVLNLSGATRAACGNFVIDRAEIDKTDKAIRQIFGRSAQSYFAASEGRLNFGAPVYADTQFIRTDNSVAEGFQERPVASADRPVVDRQTQERRLRPSSP